MEACNKAQQKTLDEFTSRIIECRINVGGDTGKIRNISDRLNGPEPQDDEGKGTDVEPSTIFDQLHRCIGDLEITIKSLSYQANRLDGII